MTEVSRTPRGTRCSTTRFDALVGNSVEVASELVAVDGRRCLEELGDGFCGHEAETPKWSEFTDRLAVACDDEGLAFVEASHDLATAVS